MATVAMAPEDEYTLKFFLKPRLETAKGELTNGAARIRIGPTEERQHESIALPDPSIFEPTH